VLKNLFLDKIESNIQHMMFLSGLRGAIAFALSIRNTLTESRQMILTTTLILVIVTVIFCGGSTLTMLTTLGVPLGVNDDENQRLSSPAQGYDSVAPGPGVVAVAGGNSSNEPPSSNPAPHAGSVPGKSWLARIWGGFDSKYMKPLFTHATPSLMETTPSCCLPIARFLTSQEQLAAHPSFRLGIEFHIDIVHIQCS
jgi:sodium/hydrogen exchanger-like protein 6/7